jgi:hypothetical protein
MQPGSRHQCLVYEGPPSRQLPALAEAVSQKLRENYRCLYLNSVPMLAGMRSYLAAAGVDVEFELQKGSLVMSSDQDHAPDGIFDVDGMLASLEQAVQKAVADGYTGLFATGDMAWELGPDRDVSRLLDYEWKLEQMFHRYPQLSGICQYHADTLPFGFAKLGLASHVTHFIDPTLSIGNPRYAHSARAGQRLSQRTEVELPRSGAVQDTSS